MLGREKSAGLLPPPHTHTHSFTTRLHGGERQNNRLLRCLLPPLFVSYSLQVTRSSYSVERAMEVLLQDYTGARRASYQTVRRLFFLFSTTRLHGGQQPTNQPDDDGWCCCCFFSSRKQIFLNIIIIHLLHSQIHCDLNTLAPNSHYTIFISFPTERKFSLQWGEFFPSTLLATLLISNLPPEGRKSRDVGSGGGNFILEEIFTSPGTNLTIYYCGVACALKGRIFLAVVDTTVRNKSCTTMLCFATIGSVIVTEIFISLPSTGKENRWTNIPTTNQCLAWTSMKYHYANHIGLWQEWHRTSG